MRNILLHTPYKRHNYKVTEGLKVNARGKIHNPMRIIDYRFIKQRDVRHEASLKLKKDIL